MREKTVARTIGPWKIAECSFTMPRHRSVGRGSTVGVALARVSAATAVLVFAGAVPAASEELGRVTDASELVAGPVFAGPGAVWVERDASGQLFLARSVSQRRVPVGVPPSKGLRYEVVDLAASARRVALVRRTVQPRETPGGSCTDRCPSSPLLEPLLIADEVWAGRPGRPLRRLSRRGARALCAGALAPVEVEVSDETVLVSESVSMFRSCRRYVTPRPSGRVRAYRPGGAARTLARLRGGRSADLLAAEGHWAAWRVANRERQGDEEAMGVNVVDLRRGRTAYRIANRRYLFSHLDVDAAGRLALLGPPSIVSPCHANESRETTAVAVASPAESRALRLKVRAQPEAVALSRGRLVLSEVEPRCFDPIGFTSRAITRRIGAGQPFQLPCRLSFANPERPEFDGRRLLYAAPTEGCSLNAPLRVIATSTS